MRTEIHVVTSRNRPLYEEEMDTYHRIRHRIYIEQLKWRGLVPRPDGREIDQFDLDTTAHFLAVQSDQVVGGARLNRTDGPHLLANVFPHLATAVGGPPRGPQILEWTRIFVTDDVRSRDTRPKTADVIIASLMEYAVGVGAVALTTVMAAWWLPKLHGYGWRIQPLSLPTLHDDEWLMGGRIEVDRPALAAIRDRCGIRGSALVFRGVEQEEVRHAVSA